MSSNNSEIEKRLWEAADELRANSKLRSSEYSTPVLGLVFLKWADYKFSIVEEEFQKKAAKSKRAREIGKVDYHAKGVMYLPEKSRFSFLMKLPEKSDIGKAINDAMKSIEDDNEDLRGVLPSTYHRFDSRVLFSLLRIFNAIPMDVEGDVFGQVYEYFLGKFAMAEGQKGGEFFTPISIVRLIVEIIEPFHGRIYDPACGSGGMFVQSARFVQEHKKNPSEEISIYGQERVSETVRLCKMNIAVHGLSGDIRESNTYYQDIHQSLGKFDFVMANPPFNVDRVDKERIKNDIRFPFGLPKPDNANYLWIQLFYSSLNSNGRGGFVMPYQATTVSGSEQEIRSKLIRERVVDVIISISSNFFYTVSVPCTLWFLDMKKPTLDRRDKVLFVDARKIFEQVSRSQRKFSKIQVEFISNIIRLYRGQNPSFVVDSGDRFNEIFPSSEYADIPELCKVVEISTLAENNWNLNPGAYIDIIFDYDADGEFYSTLREMKKELLELDTEARSLSVLIQQSTNDILEGSDET